MYKQSLTYCKRTYCELSTRYIPSYFNLSSIETYNIGSVMPEQSISVSVVCSFKRCSNDKTVVHLSTSISKFDYNTLCCGMTVGGAIGLTAEQYRTVSTLSSDSVLEL